MKTIKRLLLITSCFAGIHVFTGQLNPDQRIDYISQHVADLSADQKAKLQEIEVQYQSDIRSTDPTRMDSLRHATDRKIQVVLTNTQYEQYQSLTPYR
jgi:hypothetical protein